MNAEAFENHMPERRTIKAMSQIISPSIHQFLAGFPLPIQHISQKLAFVIKEAIPDLIERVYPGWRLIGYRQGTKNKSRYFCFVAPFVDHVRLGFEYGVFLADPLGVLEGSGSQVRHVSIQSLEEIEKFRLSTFVKDAAYLASLPKQELFLIPPASKGAVRDAKKRR